MKRGDIVNLKCGGPKMTVLGTSTEYTTEEVLIIVKCAYHLDTGKLEIIHLPSDVLEVLE